MYYTLILKLNYSYVKNMHCKVLIVAAAANAHPHNCASTYLYLHVRVHTQMIHHDMTSYTCPRSQTDL